MFSQRLTLFVIVGGKVLGHYIDTFDPDSEYMTGRSVPIPTSANDALWFGLAQWYGILEDEMTYVLPNIGNFGCDLYNEKVLFLNGTLGVPRCGGDIVRLKQVFNIDEGRYLTSKGFRSCGCIINGKGRHTINVCYPRTENFHTSFYKKNSARTSHVHFGSILHCNF